jgi:lactate dehydrogenase-like 2-hydroxyacid dehydrogenase
MPSPVIVFLDSETLGSDAEFIGLRRLGILHAHPFSSPIEIIRRVRDADVIITNKCRITAEVISAAPELKLICVAATGSDNVDVDHATKKGIQVKSCVGYSTPSVVEHTFSMFFHLLHRTNYFDEYVKAGLWSASPFFSHHGRNFYELAGHRWGIIGLGAIGRRVAQVATAFGASVCYYSTSGANETSEFERVSLVELMRTCMVVSVHAPLTDSTRGLIGDKELALLPTSSYLLNLGRGGIIDEYALVRALDEKFFHVGLDVVDGEPISVESPLQRILDRENVLITPHIGWASVEARKRLMQQIIAEVKGVVG